MDRPLMKFNASGGEPRETDKPLESMTKEELIRVAVGLHGLLDHIDTLGDIYKPSDLPAYTRAFAAAVRTSCKRHEFIWSDGHRLMGRTPKP